MSRSKPRTARRPHKRVKRRLKRRLLIVVEGDEGKSEQDYFQRLAQVLRSPDVSPEVKVVPGKGEPSKVLKTCTEFPKFQDFDEKFLVVDVDEHQTLQSTLKEAEGKGISVVVTNRQFEQWLYWHLHDDDGGDEKSMMRKLRKDGLLVGEKDKELGAKFPVSNYPKAVGRAQRLWPTMKVNAQGPYRSSSIPCLIEAMKG